MIWNPKYETMPQAELKDLQGKRLKNMIQKIYDNVPFYKSKLNAHGVKPDDIRTISDICKLPFTAKDDMRDVYPYGLLAVGLKEIVEIHTSSGTTGKPVVDAYTRGDIDLWSEVMARTFTMGGVTADDVVQNAYGYGLFTGGLGAHYGAQRVGATCIPISSGNTKRQIDVIRDFGTTVLTCTPSYCLNLAEVGQEMGADFSKLKFGFFGAEPWSESTRAIIEEKLDIKAFDIFGLTEIIGPGVAAECECRNMLHVFEDHFYPEIINPKTGEPLPDGEKGELVFTTLTKEGTPIIRYRTRDITYLTRELCDCGRTLVRMHKILGRTDDMMIVRGVNVFPSQIEQVLFQIDGISPVYKLGERQECWDKLRVHIEMTKELFAGGKKSIEAKRMQIERELHDALLIRCEVVFQQPNTIARSEGKAKLFMEP